MYQDCVQVNCRLTLKYAILVTLIELNVNTSARAHSVLAALTVYCSWFFSYRELPSLAKNYVIRMLFLDQPLPQAAVALWVKKDSQKWVSTPATLSCLRCTSGSVVSGVNRFDCAPVQRCKSFLNSPWINAPWVRWRVSTGPLIQLLNCFGFYWKHLRMSVRTHPPCSQQDCTNQQPLSAQQNPPALQRYSNISPSLSRSHRYTEALVELLYQH